MKLRRDGLRLSAKRPEDYFTGESGLVKKKAGAVGTLAIGSLAVGAAALGAFAIGALAIGALAIGRARIKRLEIDELVVHKLRIIESVEMVDITPIKSEETP